MRLDRLPPLFDRVPAGLFAPLAGTYAPLYWDVLGRLYRVEFEGEPQHLVRETAIELALDALRASHLWSERREELSTLDADLDQDSSSPADEAEIERATACRLIARLERSGWFLFEYRSTIGHVLSFHPYAARILETLVRVARDQQPLFQGYAHAIAALCVPSPSRPGRASPCARPSGKRSSSCASSRSSSATSTRSRSGCSIAWPRRPRSSRRGSIGTARRSSPITTA